MRAGMDPFAIQAEEVRREWMAKTAASISASLKEVFSRYKDALVAKGGPSVRRTWICSINDLNEPANVALLAQHPSAGRKSVEQLMKTGLVAREHARSIIEKLADRAAPPPVAVLRCDADSSSDYRLLPIPLNGQPTWVGLLKQWSQTPIGIPAPKSVRDGGGWMFDTTVAAALRERDVGHLLVYPVTDARFSDEATGDPDVLCGLAYLELEPCEPANLVTSLAEAQDELKKLHNDLGAMWAVLLCYDMVAQDRAAPSWVRFEDVFDSQLIAEARTAAAVLSRSKSAPLKRVAAILQHTCASRHERRRIGIASMRDLVLRAIRDLSQTDALATPEVYRYSQCFAEHEERLFLIPAHREHFIHQFQVYLLGLCLLTKPNVAAWFRRRLRRCHKLVMSHMKLGGSTGDGIDYSPLDLHRSWFIAAIMHDIGSPLEKVGDLPAELAEEFLCIPEFAQNSRPFQGIAWHGQRGRRPKRKKAERDDAKPWKPPRLWSELSPVCSILDLLSLYQSLAADGKALHESDENYHWLEAESSVSAKLLYLIEGKTDHAALGAVLAMQAGIGGLRGSAGEGDSGPSIELLKVYLPAAHAVLLHDLKSATEFASARSAKKRGQYLVFDDSPLAGLLAYADLVQNWGRPRDHYRSSEFLLRTAVKSIRACILDGNPDIAVSLRYYFPPGGEFGQMWTKERAKIMERYRGYKSAWKARAKVAVLYKSVTGTEEDKPHRVSLNKPEG